MTCRSRNRWLLAGAVLAALVVAPALADACPVCMAQRDEESRLAFLLTTGFLTLLPLAMIGGAVAWLRWKWLQLERAADDTRPVGTHLTPSTPSD